MADFYPLISRAVAALDNKSSEARRAVYDRARAALANQFQKIDPLLSETDVEIERQALEDAINKVEAETILGEGTWPLPERSQVESSEQKSELNVQQTRAPDDPTKAEIVIKPVEQSANFSSYRWTLYLASAYALTEFIRALYVYDTLNFDQRYIVRVVIALIIPIGLFLHSSVVRYLGGAYFVLVAASVLSPLVTAKPVWNVGLIWFFAIGVLSLPLIWFLLISKKFSGEFEMPSRNTWKRYER